MYHEIHKQRETEAAREKDFTYIFIYAIVGEKINLYLLISFTVWKLKSWLPD